jgi:hypothetical protein
VLPRSAKRAFTFGSTRIALISLLSLATRALASAHTLLKEMREGFAAINRRLDQIIQMQLDEHAARIKKLETFVFSQ